MRGPGEPGQSFEARDNEPASSQGGSGHSKTGIIFEI